MRNTRTNREWEDAGQEEGEGAAEGGGIDEKKKKWLSQSFACYCMRAIDVDLEMDLLHQSTE